MKRTYISDEFNFVPKHGTFLMHEKRSFFGSKMMDIEDLFTITELSIPFKEDSILHQQTSTNIENINNIYNFDVLKKSAHTIQLAPQQPELQRVELPSWQLIIDTDSLLENYLFAKIKEARTFEDVLNNQTRKASVDIAIKEYISINLMNRIKVKTVKMYARYYSLLDNPNLLRYDVKYDLTVKTAALNNIIDANAIDNIQIDKSLIDDTTIVIYKQTKNALLFKFDYYYDVVYEKI
jgi:hypothetical protein